MSKQLLFDNYNAYHQAHLPMLYEEEKCYVFNLKFPSNIRVEKISKGDKFYIGGKEYKIEEDYVFPNNRFYFVTLSQINGVSGVYVFFHFLHGYLYIGQSQDIKKRVKNHIPNLDYTSDPEDSCQRFGIPKNCLLMKAIEKFKISSINSFLERSILIYFPIENDKERKLLERKMIFKYKPIFNSEWKRWTIKGDRKK